MMADGETQWAELLVRGIDPKVLARVRRDAARRSLAVSDFIRMLLCHHYDLDCPSSKRTARPSKGSTTILLRLHPHLKQEIEIDVQMKNESADREWDEKMKQVERGELDIRLVQKPLRASQGAIVRQILEARYTRKRAA
jgi:hypothetical protein